jgi:hypothetical protein
MLAAIRLNIMVIMRRGNFSFIKGKKVKAIPVTGREGP